MKLSRWLISAIVCWAISASLLTGYSWGGTMLTKVEKLTELEIKEIMEAEKDVRAAQGNLKIIQQRIAATHGCTEEQYMEWKTSVKFDGEYILFYRINFLHEWQYKESGQHQLSK